MSSPILDVVTLILGSVLAQIRHTTWYLVIPRAATSAPQSTVQLAVNSAHKSPNLKVSLPQQYILCILEYCQGTAEDCS